MRLSDLLTGQVGVIEELDGNGALKTRLHEMGFVTGRKIKAIKSAPLKDPVEYDIMGYKVTIRKKDADKINISPFVDSSLANIPQEKFKWKDFITVNNNLTEKEKNNSKTINVALVGNPNCGKTTIFNHATNSRERVANYSGVTVAAKEAQYKLDGYTLNFIDLPGTYSLSSYSPEELFVTDYLINQPIDIILNVVDSGNMERNMYLTTQLIDLGLPTVIAVNMYDELKLGNGKLDYEMLSDFLGMPLVPTVGLNGKGLNKLFTQIIDYHEATITKRNIQINYGKEIEDALLEISEKLRSIGFKKEFLIRFLSIQLLIGDKNIKGYFSNLTWNEISTAAKKERKHVEQLWSKDLQSEIVNQRYGFIKGALKETYHEGVKIKETVTQKIDGFLTNKTLGIPIFFAIVWFIFFCTFKLGEYPMGWIGSFVEWIGNLTSTVIPTGIANSLVVDGIIGGVGGVLEFLPQIFILFLLISILEDSGYMARTAFIMDKVMHKAGLHGKSFIPLLMGFGCNIPAIMATRTIESKRDRMVTMFITPFMSCSARLPVYVLFISAFFPKHGSLILFGIYGIGILAAFSTALILNKSIFKKAESPFVMELPPYRFPTVKAISMHTWFKTKHFIKKMGTVILVASIVVWALGYFPRDKQIIQKYDTQIAAVNSDSEVETLELSKQKELLEQSYVSRIGKVIQPVFEPLGFDWKMSVSVLTGLMAKEVVVSSMGLLYQAGTDADESSNLLVDKLRISRAQNNTPLVVYFGFLVFVLLYFPCLGTLIAIKKETARLQWTLFSAIYPLFFAWGVTFIIVQIGKLL